MHNRFFVLLIFLTFLPTAFFAQEKDPTKRDKISLYTDLAIGQDFDLGENEVTFLRVLSDSRCPKQVTCIWPGEAKVLLGIRRNGHYFEKEIVFSGAGGGVDLNLFEDLNVWLNGLEPYPEKVNKIPLNSYCLQMVVSPAKEDQ